MTDARKRLEQVLNNLDAFGEQCELDAYTDVGDLWDVVGDLVLAAQAVLDEGATSYDDNTPA